MLDLLFGGDIKTFVVSLMLSLPIIFISLSVHETAHGYVAYKLGDPTARNLGRLTLNPLKHIDIAGFACMLLFGFGWAKPVPINTRYFKKPKRDMALTGLAGPMSNLLLALLFAILLKVELSVAEILTPNEFGTQVIFWLTQFLFIAVRLNISLAVFNLIPVPPLDGSRIFLVLLPPKTYFKVMQYEQYIYIILIVALFFGLLDTPIQFVTNLFMNIIFKIAF